MTQPPPPPGVTAAALHAGAPLPGSWRAYLELTKPGITRLVLVTTAVGVALGVFSTREFTAEHLALGALCLLGTALCSASANALNQVWEWKRDALMPRTCARPVPTRRIDPGRGALFGVGCGVAGVSLLATLVTPASAVVALATILIYVLLYTPSKVVSTASTILGAVPGALPPVIGYAAIGGFGSLAEPAPWTLFAIMFLWQIPHFLAIAWMHRDGYARGGFRVLPLEDPDGRRTARAALVWSVCLAPLSLTPIIAMPWLFGWVYAPAAVLLSVFLVRRAMRFGRRRDRDSARGLFLASIAHLPMLLLALVADAAIGAVVGGV